MEWNNENNPRTASAHSGAKRGRRFGLFSLRTASVVLLFSVTVLVVALLTFLVVGNSSSEKKYVDSNKFQVVFMSDGQFYFGRIRNLNNQYVRMTDIFYLRTNQQVQPEQDSKKATASPVLVPLGCELHRPQNEMLINRDQVIWWENLKADQPENTVPGAIKKYLAENPKGQTCKTNETTN